MDIKDIRNQSEKTMRILVVQGGTRSENSCPGRNTKIRSMVDLILESSPDYVNVDVLDLAVEGDGKRIIQPCKGCVGTAGGFHCHWKCTCYGPKSDSSDLNDIMHDDKVYDRLEMSDGIMFMTPIHWFKPSGPILAMLDRLVCASLTITREQAKRLTDNDLKNPEKTMALEKSGKYDNLKKNHLGGKVAAVFAQGDDGADDYYNTINKPNTTPGNFMEDVYSSPIDAVIPLVKALRFMDIEVPDDLIVGVNRGKGKDYAVNDETYKSAEKYMAIPVNLFLKLVNRINDLR